MSWNILNVTSCMAGNAESMCRAITRYIGEKLGIETTFVDGMPWPAREALLDQGRIHLCWICGLPYVWKADAGAAVELCVVPVMRHERYANEAVYFSDVVVRRDSRFKSFADLRGASWAYNEPRSHSGHNVVCHYLSGIGETSRYFGDIIESGAHQTSLEMIVGGRVDASAIDSTVLEAELRLYPALDSEIRIVATLGPSPMPPWVLHKSVPLELRVALRRVLLEMHEDAEASGILEQWGISHFAPAVDVLYDPIRKMSAEARHVTLA
ncbi:MAG: ABC-type phosphate/phosphonate transport system, periplasmic component [Myxococcales bacterium]|nr:ABC-type phosphate/phosphonate transport system, periplasmic component [Myxococcales bacterium]